MNTLGHIVLASVLTCALTSCGILGDKGLPIEFVNRTGQHIVLWEQGRPHAGARRELAANERYRDVWVDPRIDDYAKDLAMFRVEATDDAGNLIYCYVFSWNDLTRAGWVVDVRIQNDCPS